MEHINDTLFIIPARGESKGLPGKNIRELNGKPLILYTVDAAKDISKDENICVSTDDKNIANLVKEYGLKVPFIRPKSLATDTADTWSVVKHALNYYRESGHEFSKICLLQPTSPLRNSKHILECFQLWNSKTEMLVSVKKSKRAAAICSENENGFLNLTLNRDAKRRQDIIEYFEYNGAIYLLDILTFEKKSVKDFTKVKKYVMSETHSVDIDNELDFKFCEFILKNKLNSD